MEKDKSCYNFPILKDKKKQNIMLFSKRESLIIIFK